MLQGLLAAEGSKVGRRHVRTLMRRMGMETVYRAEYLQASAWPQDLRDTAQKLEQIINSEETKGLPEGRY